MPDWIGDFVKAAMPGVLPWVYGIVNLIGIVWFVWKALDLRKESAYFRAEIASLWAEVKTMKAHAEAEALDQTRILSRISEQGERNEKLLDKLLAHALALPRGFAALAAANAATKELGWDRLGQVSVTEPPSRE